MKKSNLFWGLGFLLAATLIILDVIGIIPSLLNAVGEVSVFSLILGFLLLFFIIKQLLKGRLSSIFFPLAFIFMLFEKNIAFLCGLESQDIVNNWLVLLVALLLHLGFAMLLPSRRILRKHKKRAVSNNNTLNSATVYVDCASFTPNTVSNRLGECTVYFQNASKYQGEQTLTVSNSLGSMTINVPAAWTAIVDVDNALGSLEAPLYSDNGGPVLYIKGDNHLGALEIVFV
ncbi:MAG: hypothetical protein J6W28_06225 [Clostridia bacterium]|nr:hypothetical protein [Clostridia bacterium]